MTWSSFFASVHYLALAIGFAGVVLRGIGFKESLQGAPLKRVFLGDNLWGIAAFLWVATGLMRAFGGLEKGATYYMQNHWFYAKMGFVALLFALEVWPMVTLIRWRIGKKSELAGATDRALVSRFLVINRIEILMVLLIPFFASLMARGGLIQR